MSYLPRMSKTYKEPEERNYDYTTEEITFNSIPIASALPDDKSYNPQTVLKQYNFYPHPPPQLPGPSLIEEAEQNEKISTEARRQRTRGESLHSADKGSTEEYPYATESKTAGIHIALTAFNPSKADSPGEMPAATTKTTRTKIVPKKAHLKSKAFEKELNEPEKKRPIDEKDEKSKKNETESISLASSEAIFYIDANEIRNTSICEATVGNSVKDFCSMAYSDKLKTVGKSGSKKVDVLANDKQSVSKTLTHQGVQCCPHGLNEKIFTMPSSVHYLTRTLSFLVHELDKKEEHDSQSATKEAKKLLNQINESISALQGCLAVSGYTLQTSVSDSKRLEKIHSDLEEYIKLVYGERGKFGCKSEEKRKVYCKLSQKDYELRFLHEKLLEGEIQNPNLKSMNYTVRSPEVVLQNKNLENEQLTAEIEFNNEELKRFQQTLAEKTWEIHKSKEEIVRLKKKLATLKARTRK